MEKSRKDSFRHVVGYYEIAIRRAKILSERRAALAERSICIRQLAFCPEYSRQSNCAAVEGIFSGSLNFSRVGMDS
jgi:hypothetical protein